MKSTGSRPFLIDTVAQIKTLVAPTRQEILDALQIIGPATVAALAETLGRAPDSLYHHIRILVGVGLVEKVETRRGPSGQEAVFDLPSREMKIAYDLRNPLLTDAVNAVVRSMSRIACRDFERAAERGEAVVEGPGRNLRGARMKGLLDAAQIKKINSLYKQMVDVMNTPPRDSGKSELHAVTFLMSPLRRSDRAETAGSQRNGRTKR